MAETVGASTKLIEKKKSQLWRSRDDLEKGEMKGKKKRNLRSGRNANIDGSLD